MVFCILDALFGAVKLTENADPDKYSYFGYDIGCISHSLFHFQNFIRVIMFLSLE